MGILALGGGALSLSNPTAGASALGIPISSSSPALSFVGFVGARNIGSGVTILALLATGQKKAVGVCLMCGTLVAMLDSWICSKSGAAAEGKALGHAVMGLLAGGLGAGLWWL